MIEKQRYSRKKFPLNLVFFECIEARKTTAKLPLFYEILGI